MNREHDEARLWASRMRARYPSQAAGFSTAQLEAVMAGWVGLLAPLGIEEHEDQVRFLALSVLLTPEQRRSPLAMGVLRRTMDTAEWEPRERLDFIYKHLVGRPVSESEEDFGPNFYPPLTSAE